MRSFNFLSDRIACGARLAPQTARIVLLVTVTAVPAVPRTSKAQFYEYTRTIPQYDSTGAPLTSANTTFADGSVFIPTGNNARSSKWAWRPYGDVSILSSLGPSTTVPPSETKELATTVSDLKPGSSYDVRLLFWNTGLWGVRGGLTYANGLRTNLWFDNTSADVVPASLLAWNSTMPSVFSESGRTLLAAPLGTGVADSSGCLRVFVHDLPATDSNYRTWYQGVAVSELVPPGPHLVDLEPEGTSFHRGVRGQALADPQVDWGGYWVGLPKALQAARGSAIRGVSTGLAADRYDWRTRNGQPRPTALQFLRYSRDYDADLFLGVNMRGLIKPDPAGGWLYYDTNTATLATLAADWVRYVTHIVPAYRQGSTISDSRDAAILDSLTWSSTVGGDAFDKLLAPDEPPVAQDLYWEIGNEPTIGVTSFSVNNSFTMGADDYHLRYRGIVEAMKAENPDIKVGPTLVNGSREEAQLAALVSDSSLPIDFITYHPYERMGSLTDPALITLHLGSIFSRQKAFYDGVRKVVADNGRNPDAIEYAATEVNVSNWDTNETEKEAGMAHALGTVETVFSHARLGLVASHYWIWPAHQWDGTEYPVFKAYEKLRDHMGDTLLSYYACGDARLYTTRDSRTGEIAVWALNFLNNQAADIDLSLVNLPRIERATLLRLADKSGTTTLFSANLASDMAGGPTMNVDWTSADLTGTDFTNFHMNLAAATLSIVVVTPGLDRLIPEFVEQDGRKEIAVTFKRIPHASEMSYKLLASTDLANWSTVGEAAPGTSQWVTLTEDFIPGTSPRFLRVEAFLQH